jgi:hypothetical protein
VLVDDGRQGRDGRILRRTQRTIALVRASFAVVATGAIVVVLLNDEHNQDEYELPGVAVTVRLWQALAGALVVLVVVFIGAIAELARAVRRRHFET